MAVPEECEHDELRCAGCGVSAWMGPGPVESEPGQPFLAVCYACRKITCLEDDGPLGRFTRLITLEE